MAGSKARAIFRQLFDLESYTYTYLLGCPKTRAAVIIDPVDTQAERDVRILKELDLKLIYAMNTHVHADHVTGTGILKSLTGCKSVISKLSGAKADVFVHEGDTVDFGDQRPKYLSCLSVFFFFLKRKTGIRGVVLGGFKAFALPVLTPFTPPKTQYDEQPVTSLKGGTPLAISHGRGSPEKLYDSVTSKILSLPEDYLLYPAHDYHGMTVSTVAEELRHNPRLTKSKEEFVEIMKSLGLTKPKKMDEAVPLNIMCGPSQLGESQQRMDQ
ncbi:unnamed protein product [Porites evermanni]|uniref:Metallo-beta-lactamase domain-containing protein n=1 Tax=Porites evermanni TaxID=104178 RepID=A0ABN8STJ9_9CNID|nr:unnamed protein product [Porites evermanni]